MTAAESQGSFLAFVGRTWISPPQILFTLVVIAVFANRPDQSPWMVATVILFVGAVGLLVYSTAGSLFRNRTSSENGLRMLDLVAGILLCLVGFWLMLQPLLQRVL